MNRLIKILLLFILYIPVIGYSQNNKCTNSADDYLCDRGFENNAVRNGNMVHPKQRSSVRTNLKEVNHCLGGPYTGFEFDTIWNNTLWWYTHGPYYPNMFDHQDYLNIEGYGMPDFLSWYQPTNASPDYFHRNAAYTSYDNLVAVPNNFIGYQEPAEGEQGNGYVRWLHRRS